MQTSMNVKLLAYTPEPEKVVAMAARLCYKKISIDELKKEIDSMTKDDIAKQIDTVIRSGHLSVAEHASFTFGIEGVSRALTHQLVRHRIASYSQQSQRYVDGKNFNYILPPSIAASEEKKKIFNEFIESVPYEELYDPSAVPKEDARFVLPNAAETKIIMTMNARSLYNFFDHRCCARAQWEIREMANRMLELVKGVAPSLFAYAGPFCISQRQCREKQTCGKYKTIRGSRWLWEE